MRWCIVRHVATCLKAKEVADYVSVLVRLRSDAGILARNKQMAMEAYRFIDVSKQIVNGHKRRVAELLVVMRTVLLALCGIAFNRRHGETAMELNSAEVPSREQRRLRSASRAQCRSSEMNERHSSLPVSAG